MKKIVFAFLATLCFSIPALADEGTGNIRGDVDLDGNVNIADVTALIDYLLTGQWPAAQAEPEVFTVNGVSFTMIPVEAGTFTMGATKEQESDAYGRERPAHEVTLTKDFFIGQTEVTQGLWVAVMGSNPSGCVPAYGYSEDLQRPVENVTWAACQEFITKLNELTGKQFRLPTEAEWEFAARGGNLSQEFKYSGSDLLDEVGWYQGNLTSDGTHPVGTKAPNELGLYDMSGNVREICQDFYDFYTDEPQVDPTGPGPDYPFYEYLTEHVYRGGAYLDKLRDCRVSFRQKFAEGELNANRETGLRLAL